MPLGGSADDVHRRGARQRATEMPRRTSRHIFALGNAVADRVAIGSIEVDRVTFAGALDAIEDMIRARRGGAVFTPNVDHVVLADEHDEFRRSYRGASLCLADGMPLVWTARLLGSPVPEKVSGSDLVPRLMERAAARGHRVYLLGGALGSAAEAARMLTERGVIVVGADAPVLRDPLDAAARRPIVDRIRDASPDLVLVAFGAPKQELFIDAVRRELNTVLIGVGGTLEFIAGRVPRAPQWMSGHGLEWLYRLVREPRRLWRRYLVRDPRFALIVARMLMDRRAVPSTARTAGLS
jgi:N-acetylglucosaminyldiphosphoundecaprenol N-acetyl-beta-D-mannosaminyltransferase